MAKIREFVGRLDELDAIAPDDNSGETFFGKTLARLNLARSTNDVGEIADIKHEVMCSIHEIGLQISDVDIGDVARSVLQTEAKSVADFFFDQILRTHPGFRN